MINNNPIISVIIPVFNGEKFLHATTKNILQQTYRPIEIIVIDDGSTDHTAKIAKQFKKDIKYLYQTNKGTAAARNLGIKNSHGDFIAFNDADDLWPKPNRLEKQITILRNNPQFDIVRGSVKIANLSDASQTYFKQRINKANKMLNITLCSALFRKSVFNKVGYLDEDLDYGEDLDWYIRALEINTHIHSIDETALHYRLHSTNKTNKNYNYIKLIKKLLDRRGKNLILRQNFINNFISVKNTFLVDPNKYKMTDETIGGQ